MYHFKFYVSELKNGMRGSSCPLYFLITEKLAHKNTDWTLPPGVYDTFTFFPWLKIFAVIYAV
jgi:hypothetical protein